jgi:mono/diheme cytochrome c family protein
MFSKIPTLTAALTLSLLLACGGGDDAVTPEPAPETTPEATPEPEVEPETEAEVEEPATEEPVVETGLPERLQTYLATFDDAARAKANPLSGKADAISAGQDEFQSTCFPCHGREGKGDGPAARAMGIKPGDMSDPVRGAAMTAGEQYIVMKHGIPDTAMQPFGAALSDDQIWRVLAFVESLRPAAEPEPEPEKSEGG